MKNKFKVIDDSGDRKYFTIIPNYIVNHSTVYEQAIYLYMKRVAGEEGTCWTSAKEISKKLGCSRNTVSKYQKKLVTRGWIEVIGRRPTGITNQSTLEYRIVDLWSMNIRFYEEKYKRSSVERYPDKRSSDDKSVQLVNGKSSTSVHKEEPLKKNQEEKREKEATHPFSSKIKYLSQIPEEDIEEFAKKCAATEEEIRDKGEDLKLHCESKGRTYKNYRSFLLGVLKQDYPKRKIGKYGGL